MKDFHFIPTDDEIDGGWRSIEEVDQARVAGSLDEETPDPKARNAGQIVIPAGEWHEDHLDEPFGSPGQMLTQAHEALSVFTESVETHRHGPAIGPVGLVSLVVDVFFLPVFRWIATEKYGKAA